MGRRSWLFADTVGGANAIAKLYSLIETAQANGVDTLPVDKGASPAMVGFVIWQHQLAKATLGFHAGPREE